MVATTQRGTQLLLAAVAENSSNQLQQDSVRRASAANSTDWLVEFRQSSLQAAICVLRLVRLTSAARCAVRLRFDTRYSELGLFRRIFCGFYKMCMAFSIRGNLVLALRRARPSRLCVSCSPSCCGSCSAGVRKLLFYASVLSVRLPSQAAVVGGGDGAGFGWPCGGSHPSTPSYNHDSSAVVLSSTDESYRCHHHRAFANAA